jgi:hypothetical protein
MNPTLVNKSLRLWDFTQYKIKSNKHLFVLLNVCDDSLIMSWENCFYSVNWLIDWSLNIHSIRKYFKQKLEIVLRCVCVCVCVL